MTDGALLIQIENAAESLGKALEAVQDFALSRDVPQTAVHRIQVALDEMITNIFSHGYEGGSGTVDLSIKLRGDFLELYIVDHARPFNPLRQAQPEVDLPIENRPIGGVGIHLVRTLIDEIEYSRQGTENHLLLRKKVVG